MQIGIDSFVEMTPDAQTRVTVSPVDRVRDLLEEIELADGVGLDTYSIGEHHREEYAASAPAVLLAAAAARTKHIRLGSAVTVLSSDDPIRVFQDFATLDLISKGRAEIIVGRGSFVESYPLFGFNLNQYDDLFVEKLDLLLAVRENARVHWSGRFRSPLTGQGVYPRPVQKILPIWIGVGGTPNSFASAGALGLPLAVAIIGGEPHRFRPLIEHYREAGRRAGHSPEQLSVAVHSHGFVGNTTEQAADDLFQRTPTPLAKSARNAAGRLRRAHSSMSRAERRELSWWATRRWSPKRSCSRMKFSAASRELAFSSPPEPSRTARSCARLSSWEHGLHRWFARRSEARLHLRPRSPESACQESSPASFRNSSRTSASVGRRRSFRRAFTGRAFSE